MRWTAAGLYPRYLLTPLMLIDFVNLLPALVGANSPLPALRLLRVLRILRLRRLLGRTEVNKLAKAITGDPEVRVGEVQRVGLTVALSVLSIVFITAGAAYEAEHAVNPMFASYADALYFSITTLTVRASSQWATTASSDCQLPSVHTGLCARMYGRPLLTERVRSTDHTAGSDRERQTVGFGDVVPITQSGRVIVALEMIAAVTLIPLEVTRLVAAFEQQASEQASEQTSELTERRAAADAIPPSSRRVEVVCANCSLRSHEEDAAFCRRCGLALPL